MMLELEILGEKTFLNISNIEKKLPRVLHNALWRTLLWTQGQIDKNLRTNKFNIRHRTGQLSSSFESKVNMGQTSFIGILGSNLKYAQIQERGGWIFPKGKKALHFKIGGRDIFSKNVVIPPHWYVRNTFLENKEKIVDILSREIGKELPK